MLALYRGRKVILALALTLLGANPSFAQQREIPALSSPVIDEARLLSNAELSLLEERLRSQKELVQAQIWIVSSLGDEPIEALSIRATDQWKLGTEKKDNGVLILVAPNERKIRIEVGQGLEGAIPDALAGRMIDQIIRPLFKRGQFYEGLNETVSKIFGLASGDPMVAKDLVKKSRSQKTWGESIFGLLFFGFFLLFFIIGPALGMVGGRRRRGLLGGVIGGSSWGSSSSGWSSGGGSSWSGGGGGFSGGGSSGSW